MSHTNPVRVGVVGAGSFGTCLSILTAELGHSVVLWTREPGVAEGINRHHRNPRYLTEFRIPQGVRATRGIEEVVRDQDLIISVVPMPSTMRIPVFSYHASDVGLGSGSPAETHEVSVERS